MFRMTDSGVKMVLSALIILTLFHVALRLMKLMCEFAPTLTTETYGPPVLGESASEQHGHGALTHSGAMGIDLSFFTTLTVFTLAASLVLWLMRG